MSFTNFVSALAASNAGGVPDYYYNQITDSGERERYVSINVDADGNVYLAGNIRDNGPNAFCMKINADTSVAWTRELGSTSTLEKTADVTSDSSGNVYVVFASTQASGGQAHVVVAKYNSSGTQQYLYDYGGIGVNGVSGTRIVHSDVDGTDRLYVAFWSNNKIGFLKLTASDGAQVYDTLFRDTSNNIQAVGGLAVDSVTTNEGLFFIAARSARDVSGNSNRSALGLKIGSNGETVNSRIFGITDNSGYDTGEGIAIDDDNIYLLNVTVLSNTTYDPISIIKYNRSTFNTVWAREFEPSDGDVTIFSDSHGPQLKMDSNGNLFVSMYVNGNIILVKYNSSGTLQYQKKLDGNATLYPNGLFIDGNDDIYVSGFVGNHDPFVIKMPNSGLTNGTYTISGASITSLTVSTYNGTDEAATVTGAAGGISAIDLGSSRNTPTVTETTLSGTSNVSSLD